MKFEEYKFQELSASFLRELSPLGLPLLIQSKPPWLCSVSFMYYEIAEVAAEPLGNRIQTD